MVGTTRLPVAPWATEVASSEVVAAAPAMLITRSIRGEGRARSATSSGTTRSR
jgi:hypothetical protein